MQDIANEPPSCYDPWGFLSFGDEEEDLFSMSKGPDPMMSSASAPLSPFSSTPSPFSPELRKFLSARGYSDQGQEDLSRIPRFFEIFELGIGFQKASRASSPNEASSFPSSPSLSSSSEEQFSSGESSAAESDSSPFNTSSPSSYDSSSSPEAFVPSPQASFSSPEFIPQVPLPMSTPPVFVETPAPVAAMTPVVAPVSTPSFPPLPTNTFPMTPSSSPSCEEDSVKIKRFFVENLSTIRQEHGKRGHPTKSVTFLQACLRFFLSRSASQSLPLTNLRVPSSLSALLRGRKGVPPIPAFSLTTFGAWKTFEENLSLLVRKVYPRALSFYTSERDFFYSLWGESQGEEGRSGVVVWRRTMQIYRGKNKEDGAAYLTGAIYFVVGVTERELIQRGADLSGSSSSGSPLQKLATVTGKAIFEGKSDEERMVVLKKEAKGVLDLVARFGDHQDHEDREEDDEDSGDGDDSFSKKRKSHSSTFGLEKKRSRYEAKKEGGGGGGGGGTWGRTCSSVVSCPEHPLKMLELPPEFSLGNSVESLQASLLKHSPGGLTPRGSPPQSPRGNPFALDSEMEVVSGGEQELSPKRDHQPFVQQQQQQQLQLQLQQQLQLQSQSKDLQDRLQPIQAYQPRQLQPSGKSQDQQFQLQQQLQAQPPEDLRVQSQQQLSRGKVQSDQLQLQLQLPQRLQSQTKPPEDLQQAQLSKLQDQQLQSPGLQVQQQQQAQLSQRLQSQPPEDLQQGQLSKLQDQQLQSQELQSPCLQQKQLQSTDLQVQPSKLRDRHVQLQQQLQVQPPEDLQVQSQQQPSRGGKLQLSDQLRVQLQQQLQQCQAKPQEDLQQVRLSKPQDQQLRQKQLPCQQGVQSSKLQDRQGQLSKLQGQQAQQPPDPQALEHVLEGQVQASVQRQKPLREQQGFSQRTIQEQRKQQLPIQEQRAKGRERERSLSFQDQPGSIRPGAVSLEQQQQLGRPPIREQREKDQRDPERLSQQQQLFRKQQQQQHQQLLQYQLPIREQRELQQKEDPTILQGQRKDTQQRSVQAQREDQLEDQNQQLPQPQSQKIQIQPNVLQDFRKSRQEGGGGGGGGRRGEQGDGCPEDVRDDKASPVSEGEEEDFLWAGEEVDRRALFDVCATLPSSSPISSSFLLTLFASLSSLFSTLLMEGEEEGVEGDEVIWRGKPLRLGEGMEKGMVKDLMEEVMKELQLEEKEKRKLRGQIASIATAGCCGICSCFSFLPSSFPSSPPECSSSGSSSGSCSCSLLSPVFSPSEEIGGNAKDQRFSWEAEEQVEEESGQEGIEGGVLMLRSKQDKREGCLSLFLMNVLRRGAASSFLLPKREKEPRRDSQSLSKALCLWKKGATPLRSSPTLPSHSFSSPLSRTEKAGLCLLACAFLFPISSPPFHPSSPFSSNLRSFPRPHSHSLLRSLTFSRSSSPTPFPPPPSPRPPSSLSLQPSVPHSLSFSSPFLSHLPALFFFCLLWRGVGGKERGKVKEKAKEKAGFKDFLSFSSSRGGSPSGEEGILF